MIALTIVLVAVAIAAILVGRLATEPPTIRWDLNDPAFLGDVELKAAYHEGNGHASDRRQRALAAEISRRSLDL